MKYEKEGVCQNKSFCEREGVLNKSLKQSEGKKVLEIKV